MNHSQLSLCNRGWLATTLLAATLATGCATSQVKPVYPAQAAQSGNCTVKLDNTMADSMWALQMMAPIGLEVTVDGFSPLEKEKLKTGGQLRPKTFIPKGVTELALAPGSHVLRHQGSVLGNTPYRFAPVDMPFETEAGKTYVIRFKNTTKPFKLKYAVEYEGWSREESAPWPSEVRSSNPIFGH